MKFTPMRLAGVQLIEPRVFGDSRGFFFEIWQQRLFAEQGLDLHFVQDNYSRSARGILRGLHYQRPNPQGKLVRVMAGTVFDVFVDVRRSSPTFGQWEGIILSDENKKMLWIPPGFAHGFYVLSEYADFFYKCTDHFYSPATEKCLLWNDPALAIDWPLLPDAPPLLSAKDGQGLLLQQADCFP